MSDLHGHRALSRVELMVLARLAAPKAPTKTEVAKSLIQIGIPLAPPAVLDCVAATLAALGGRALVANTPGAVSRKRPRPRRKANNSKPAKRAPALRFCLTETGCLALRTAFELKATPTWKDVCNRIVPTLALGEQPGSKAADVALRSTEAMIASLLRRDRTLGEPATVSQLCDQVISRALGLPPGPVTPAGMRAYALAMHCGIDSKADLEHIAARFAPAKASRSTRSGKLDRELRTLAAELTRDRCDVDVRSKPSMTRALLRRWVSQRDEADDAQRPSALPSTPLQPSQRPAAGDAAEGVLAPVATAADPLLIAVRETIPMVGSDGRYGKENVFVSALWRQLDRDRRLPDLSLDHFKRWLVAANREQLLALARADLVDDMDAGLVEDSEIEDLGATFHFVIDRQERSSASGQIYHGR